MRNLHQVLDKLTFQKNINQTRELCVSAYFPIDSADRRIIAKYVKDKILKELKRSADSESYEIFKDKISKNIASKIKISQGLAIFVILKPDIKKDRLMVVPLGRRPKEEVIIDKTFDLDQLIWVEATRINALVVEIRRHSARFYKLTDNKIEKVDQIINENNQQKEANFGRYADETIKLQRKEQHEDLGFLKEVYRFIKRDAHIIDYRYLVILHSENFSDLIDEFKDDISSNFVNLRQIQIIRFSSNDEEELKEISIERIRIEQIKNKINKLNNAKEDFNRYVKGWSSVCQAARYRRIDSLFIEANTRRQGFVLNNEFLYTRQVEGGVKVRSLGSWIVWDVIKNGGQVFVFYDDEKDDNVQISAHLRY